MDLSGIIFVVLALAWAVYLIPKALKHHDEVARTRSIDRFSTAMRVLARREPVSRRDARLVVTPARAGDNPRVLAPAALTVEEHAADQTAAAQRPVVRPAARRAAARAAGRRRRHILSFLLLATLVVTGLAAFAVVPWWSVAVPAVLTVLYLVLCRTQVRHERDARWDADLAASIDALPVARVEARPAEPARRAARVDAPYGAPRTAVRNAQGFEEVDADEDTVAIEVALLDAVVVPTVDGGSLWDPLPVTLPTYVTKPKARRTVRTIDLDEPGTWSSGRSTEDTELVAQTAAAEAEQTAAEDEAVETQRAVGS
ncbi:MAG: divisome protein SepX/GlpR [Nocardioides sp.]